MKTKCLLHLLLGVQLCGLTVEATVFHVGTAQELQTSLSLAASNGEDDTIYLAAGIYNGNFTFTTTEAQSLTIMAETNMLPGQVVLDGLGSGNTLNISAQSINANITVDTITLKGGYNLALVVATSGNAEIRNTVIRNSYRAVSISAGSAFSCADSLFAANTFLGSVSSSGSVVFARDTFRGNGDGYYNGSLGINAPSITVSASLGQDNISGVLSASSFTTATFSGNTFKNNHSGSQSGPEGSAINVNGGNSAYLFNNTFTQNGSSAQNYNYPSAGGAVYLASRNFLIQGNSFVANSSRYMGGAIFCGMSTTSLGQGQFANNLVISNTAPGLGGGIYISALATNLIANNTVFGNTANNGGGLYLDANANYNYWQSRNYVYNNIIWGNTAANSGGDVYVVTGGAVRNLYNNNYHSMGGLWDIALNNIDVAPLFVDALRGDYHLRANSLCINSGNNAAPGLPLVDKDGNVRVGNGVVDMGCYEHDSADKHPADANTNWVVASAEFNAYAQAWTNNAAWSTGPNPIPMDYVTRAGFLSLTNSGAYTNAGGGKPLNWKP